MNTWKRTLEQTLYRGNHLVYRHTVKTARTAEWTIELRFPVRYEDRVAAGDHGMAMPEVFAGRTALKPLAHASLPSALGKPVENLIKQVAQHEHAKAVQAGKPPAHGTRVEYYEQHGYTLTPTEAAEADRVADLIRNPFIDEKSLVSMAAKIAATTVPRKVHTETISKLEADLAEIQREQDLHTKDCKEEKKEQSDSRLMLSNSLDALVDVTDRIARRDFIGAYGSDDIAKALDLLEPAIELLQESI